MDATKRRPAPAVPGPTQARILEGAARAFAAAGYHGTTVPAIATAAGVSVGVIYRYFPSKAELFLAICAAEGAAGVAARTAELAAIEDPRKRLRAAIERFVAELAVGTRAGVHVSAYGEAEQNPRVRNLLRAGTDRVEGAAELLLTDAVARGDAPATIPIAALARGIAMLFDGAVLARVAAGERFRAEAVAEAMIALIGGALGWT